MAAPQPVFKSARGGRGALVPAVDRADHWRRYGLQLGAAVEGGSGLDRLLRVVELVLGLLMDVVRSGAGGGGGDAGSVPYTALAQHAATRRRLGTAADGGEDEVNVQEVVTMDPREVARDWPWFQVGAPLARLHWRVAPTARAKARRLGREVYVKIQLDGGGSVQLTPTTALAMPPPPPATATPSAPAVPLPPPTPLPKHGSGHTGKGAQGAGHSEPVVQGGAGQGSTSAAAGAQPRGSEIEECGRDVEDKGTQPPPPPVAGPVAASHSDPTQQALPVVAAQPVVQPAIRQAVLLPLPPQRPAPEEYDFSLPSLVLSDPLGPTMGGAGEGEGSESAPSVDFKGELVVQCDVTGLTATLSFKPGTPVTGTIEQRAPAPAHRALLTTVAASGSSSGLSSTAAVPGSATRGYTKVASLTGNWREGGIRVTGATSAASGLAARWPTMLLIPDGTGASGSAGAGGAAGQAGSGAAGKSPTGPLLTRINLAAPGPLQLHRLWIALYDSLLYNDPNGASGGKTARALSRALYRLPTFSPSLAAPTAATAGAGGAAAGASGAAGGAAQGEDEDSDESEEEEGGGGRSMSLWGRATKGGSSKRPEKDTRDVAPNFKEERTRLGPLRYQLAMTLVRAPSTALQ